MKYKQKEWNLEQQFENDCLGRKNCSLKLDFPQIFDTGCLNELKNRIQGSQDTKEEAIVYATALCYGN